MSLSIRLMIVDAFDVLRDGGRLILEECADISIVCESYDRPSSLLAAQIFRPDVILLVMQAPGTEGIDTLKAMRMQVPDIPVLAFSSEAQDARVRAVIDAGAAGYVLKDAARDDLVRSIRAVAVGDAWLYPLAQRQLLERLRQAPSLIGQLQHRKREAHMPGHCSRSSMS